LNNKYDGFGILITKKKSVSEGFFKNGLLNGKARIIYHYGDYFEGDLVNNLYCGRGKLVRSDQHYYEGEFKNGKRHGKGI
jgi:hypothetical protein